MFRSERVLHGTYITSERVSSTASQGSKNSSYSVEAQYRERDQLPFPIGNTTLRSTSPPLSTWTRARPLPRTQPPRGRACGKNAAGAPAQAASE